MRGIAGAEPALNARANRSGLRTARCAGFAIEPLGDMVAVGRVSPGSVRLWLRSARVGPHTVTFRDPSGGSRCASCTPSAEADGTVAFDYPGDFPGEPPLRASTRYRFRVERARSIVGEGSFTTPPRLGEPGPERFAIGFLSCHQPFDRRGRVRAEARDMLTAVGDLFARENVVQCFAMGDQVYADRPAGMSLYDPVYLRRIEPPGAASILHRTAEEVRRLFWQRYRIFWAVPQWRALHANVPILPMLDDHDVVNNFGSAAAHHTPRWTALRRGALEAYRDYQAARVAPWRGLPDSFHYEACWGPVATFVTDLRTARSPSEQRLLGERQLRDLGGFLRRRAGHPILMIVSSVPWLHVPRALACVGGLLTPDGDDFTDRSSHPAYHADRREFVRLLTEHRRRHPEQCLMLLTGDIHVGAVLRMAADAAVRPFLQIVASPLTMRESRLVTRLSAMSVRLGRSTARGSDGTELTAEVVGPIHRRPNAGLLQVRALGDRLEVRASLWGQRRGTPVCLFRTDAESVPRHPRAG